MTAEQLTVIITNILTSAGALTFIYFLVRSLKREIVSLNKTIETQNKTLEVMEKRITETEKVGNIYKKLVDELPEYVEKYQKFITASKDTIIAELEQANQRKDEKLAETRELDLKRIELQEQMLSELPKLRDQLLEGLEAIQERVQAMQEPIPFLNSWEFGHAPMSWPELRLIEAYPFTDVITPAFERYKVGAKNWIPSQEAQSDDEPKEGK
jgi:DNA repair exonuclease SbcCD ATPase subunit